MSEDTQVRVAEFSPNVPKYWLISGMVLMTVMVVGIPLIPFWIFFGMMFGKQYLASMECVLTDKALMVKKGIFTKVEKTVPLEKITDMGMVQGPIMRRFGLHQLYVETAGQSGPGGELSLLGIVDAVGFREAVLKQRESIGGVASAATSESPSMGASVAGDSSVVLGEIRDSLLRIEAAIERSDKAGGD